MFDEQYISAFPAGADGKREIRLTVADCRRADPDGRYQFADEVGRFLAENDPVTIVLAPHGTVLAYRAGAIWRTL